MSRLCTIMCTMSRESAGHSEILERWFCLKSSSMACHNPGPTLKVCSEGQESWSARTSGMWSGTWCKTPSHFPSSPSAMHGTSRNTFSSAQLLLMSSRSVQNCEAPNRSSFSCVTLSNSTIAPSRFSMHTAT